ncbi:MAG: serine hydrolase [Chloroflexi bacterium]|nr:serine hydrolase [Chloroflexota bacterium]
MNARFSKSIVSVLVIAALALAIVPFAGAQEGSEPDYWPTAGWRTSTPEEQGMDSETLAGMWSYLVEGKKNPDLIMPVPGMTTFIHSALVIRHGRVVLDASVYPFSNSQPHEMFSVTKSVLSTLVGIAIDQGYIDTADQSIWEFFSKEGTENMDEQKAAITLRNLLVHTSGLNIGLPTVSGVWDTGGKPYIQYVLDSPMAAAPGSEYLYQDGNADLVSALLQQATGMTAAEFAQKNLFGPLGITDTDWAVDPEGVNIGGWAFTISGYDLAKIGYLFLHGGEWDGQQIVSSAWVNASINDQLEPLQPHFWEGYSNYWYDGPVGYWFNELAGANAAYRGYAAIGWGCQFLFVIPDLDMIVVTTGDLLGAILPGATEFILNSVEAESALPGNPGAVAILQAAVEATQHPVPSPVPVFPEAASAISEERYALDSNILGWDAFSLEFGDQQATFILEMAGSVLEFPVGLDGVFRVSSDSIPSDPRYWWWHPHVQQAIKGTWADDQTFVMEMWDLAGNEGLMITVPADASTITPTLILYQGMSTSVPVTPQQ